MQPTMSRTSRTRRVERVARATLVSVALAALGANAARGGTQDFYLSVPSQGTVYRLDAVTLQATPFLTGLNTPFYGFHDQNGDFFVPDHVFGVILRVDPQGVPALVTSGGLLTSPLAVIADPAGGFVATDLYQHTVVRVDTAGNQTLIHDSVTSNDLVYGPGGLRFDDLGNLYVANNTGNTILKIDPQGNVGLFSDSPLIKTPGGVAIDGAGNMFVAMYDGHNIVRFRLDTGEAEVFAEDISLMQRPNDLKLSRGGRLLTTTRLANLVSIDPVGHITEIFKDASLVNILGVSVPADGDLCSGRFVSYGTGTAGSGGFVPTLRAVFSPCPGESFALEWKDFLGGAPSIFIVGTQQASVPALGGTLLVDLAPPSAIIPFVLPGSGPGAGDLALPFTLDASPSLTGLRLEFQTMAADPGAASGVAISNGLEMVVGT